MRTHIYPLDAVRFFSALCVMVFHLAFYDWASPSSTVGQMLAHATSYPEATPFASFGWIGVEIFFVISGFVIANSASGASPIAFAKSRVLRLYPAVWICLLFTLSAWLLAGGQTTRHLASEFARTFTLWISGPWLDGVYWSLAVEIVFYAIVFVVLVSSRFEQIRNAARILSLMSATYLLLYTFVPHIFTSPDGQWIVAHADVLQLRYGCFFALGIWMWLSTVRALKTIDWLGMLMATATCMLEIALRAQEMTKFEVPSGVVIPVITPVVLWVAVVLFIFIIAHAPESFAPTSKPSRDAMKHLGQMTYPLYLTHSVVGAFLIRTLVNHGVNPWPALAMAMLSALMLSHLVAGYAEPAVRRRLRSLWERAEGGLVQARGLEFLFKRQAG